MSDHRSDRSCQLAMRIDRGDMRLDSALDPDRPRRERLRDYGRFDYEAERAQLLAAPTLAQTALAKIEKHSPRLRAIWDAALWERPRSTWGDLK